MSPFRVSDTAFIIAGALIGALAIGWPRARRGLMLGVFSLLAVWVVVAATPLTALMARPLVRVDALGPADAVFVLGSGMQADGELSQQSMSRLLSGLALVQQGIAPQLVLSELPEPHGRYRPAAERLADELRIPLTVTTIEPVSNTHDEAVLLAELSRRRGWRKIVAVSCPVHLRRVGAVIEKQGLDVLTRPSVETRFDLQNLSRLQQHQGRIRAFGPIIHEYVGLAYYRFRGWI